MKKLFFFGTPQIAVPSLERLATLDDVEIVGVGVFPDKPVGRKQVLTPCPVKAAAQRLNLPIVEVASKDDLRTVFQTDSFDMGLVIAFGMLFPGEVLDLPRLGVVNVHFSLLPQWRGASPVQAAILAGQETSGITFQRMVKQLDAGDILLQQEYLIAGMKTSAVFADFAEKTAKLLPDFLEHSFSRHIEAMPQDESQATFCGKFTKADGEIFPQQETANDIYRKYLAFDLFPGIYLKTKKGNVKLTEVTLPSSSRRDALAERLYEPPYELQCSENTILHIHHAQVPGKKAMPVSEILRGTPDLFA